MPINVLVSGVNSTASQSIIKALKASSLAVRIFGCDINPYSPGLYRVDHGFLVPPFTDPGYEAQIIELLQRHRIDVWLPGVEPELLSLSEGRDRLERATGTRILVNPAAVLRITQDKFETARFLRAHGCNAPRSWIDHRPQNLDAIIAEVGFPLLIKPRQGSSSRHVYVVHDRAELLSRLEQVPGAVIQEYLGTADEEYTCGTFVDRHGVLKGVATLRRTLHGGSTSTAIVQSVPDVEQEVRRVIRALAPMGSCNVQLRRNRDGKPTTFEVNARFSSSVAIRTHFGFNEPEATLRSYFLEEEVPEMRCRDGVAMRYANEVYADVQHVQALVETGYHLPQSHIEQNF